MIYHIKTSNINNFSMFSKTKSIAIDTNVLLWTFYSNISFSAGYQKKIYPSLLTKILNIKGCKIYTTAVNLFEIFNVVEKTEYEIYLKLNNINSSKLTLKQYRNIESERNKLKNTCELIFKQISQFIDIVDLELTNFDLQNFNLNYTNHKYDIFDYTLVKFAKENNVDYILTDDKDFSTGSYLLDGINIMTANKNLI